MLVDLLNAENYLMINMESIRVLGLTTAAYCASLLNIYKKAHDKKKLFDEKYFLLDRQYVQKQTSLTPEQQIECDEYLIEQKIIERSMDDPDKITLNVEIYASILAAEKIVLPKVVTATVGKKRTKEEKAAAKRDAMKTALKQQVLIDCPELKFAVNDWIESCMAEGSGKMLCASQVHAFVDRLNDYCVPDVDKALKIVNIAMIHQYIDCDWAITAYEKAQADKAAQIVAQRGNSKFNAPKITTQVSKQTF